jgi:hypothetical protein
VGEGVSGDFNLGWITIVDLSVLRYHYTLFRGNVVYILGIR